MLPRARVALLVVLLAAGFLLALPGDPEAARSGVVITARQVRVYALGAADPMVLPTTVAVTPSGEVLVADGVNDRVVRFAADGSLVGTIRRAAGRSLSRPTGVAVSDDGRIWIADGDRRRVVVISPDGSGAEVPLGQGFRGALDITDLDVSPDGSRLWLVDNDGHRVVMGDLADGTWRAFGRPGDQWGEVRYPFMIARHPAGGAVVSDALNGRLQGWTADGRAERPIGMYGVSAGQMFRPKGVASTADGRTWVADGTLDVVQVFDHSGRFIDVVREPSGLALRLDGPMGIEVARGRLYVVERDAGRVREFALEESPGDPYQAVRRRAAWSEERGRECSVCHLEFMPVFEKGGAGALIPPPEDTPEQPWVSTEGSCLSCHDGTVRDSRRRIFASHGHPLGEAPPDGMVVPEELPLASGRIACRTCHSAHTLAGSGEVHSDAMLLRVEDRPSELCVACHGAEGPESAGPGSHPLGELPDREPIDCLDCHASHSPEPLLLAAGRGEGTCVECHQERVARRGAKGEHARGAVRLEAQARRALEARGGLLDARGGITCLTCHAVHRSTSPRKGCVDCHPPAAEVVGGEPLPHAGDACAACHEVHRGTRSVVRRVASPGDPSGCLSCHGSGTRHAPEQARPGEVGHTLVSMEAVGPTDRPLEGCETCHGGAHAPRVTDAASCEECHGSQADGRVAGGHGDASCLDCHPAHLDEPGPPQGLDGLNPASLRCLSCHGRDADPEGLQARVDDYQHPSMVFRPDGQRWTPGDALSLYDGSGAVAPAGDNGDLACGSCHTTHGPEASGSPRLTRTGWEESCSACHGQDSMVLFLYFHDPERRERVLGPPPEGQVPRGRTPEPEATP